MAQVLVTDTYLSDIADAIRGKLSSSDTYTPADMADAIDDIQTGATPTLIIKNISANGEYTASNDSADGYSKVVVNVQSSGDPYAIARTIADGTITSYVDPSLTKLRNGAFSNCTALTEFICHNVTSGASNAFNGTTNLKKLAFPKYLAAGYGFNNNNKVEVVDFSSSLVNIAANFFYGNVAMNTIILRHTSVCPLSNVNAISNTPFASGKAGGTIYIPKILYDHLGDGTSSDYQSAATWSTVYGYGTITWAKIEGSIYDGYYADGTAIPSS